MEPPSWEYGDADKYALKGAVTGVAAVVVGLLTKNSNLARIAGGIAGNVVGGAATRALKPVPKRYRLITIGELMEVD